MKERDGVGGAGRSGVGNDDELARLIRGAAPGPAIPARTEQRVRAAVHAAWRQGEASGRRHGPARPGRRAVWTLAAAASVALVLISLGVLLRRDTDGAADLQARVERGIGASDLRVGDELSVGRWWSTGPDGLLAISVGRHTIRMAPDSRARFLSATTLRLERGAVYLDSGTGGEAARPLTVSTKYGPVTELGTRFLVSVDERALQVRVRDGRVAVGEGAGREEAGAGEELTLDTSGGSSRRSVPVYGAGWDWVLRVAQPPPIEGRPLTELLDWVGREEGWSVDFRDATAERRTRDTVLHGDVEGLSPEEALAATLPTCGLTYVVESGRLMVDVSAGNEAR